MGFSEIHPILSGLAGAFVASLLYTLWAKWLPTERNGKPASTLLLQHRLAILLSNGAFFVGFGITFSMYIWGGFPSNDWRPLGLGMGFAFCAPLAIVPSVAFIRRCSPTEAYVAYALSQKTPGFILYPLLFLGVPLLVISVIHLVN
ncbi:MAG: hypothetical protein V4447_15695 [Pseudomonadota bacterium]